MLVSTETQKQRLLDLQEKDRKNASESLQEQKNANFTQVYPLGWKRLRELFRLNSGQQSCTLCLRKISMVPAVQL